jgi:hypothetical protein
VSTQFCVGDCLYVDENGLLQIRVDNDSIQCTDDGTGNTVLTATGDQGFLDWDLDFTCPITTGQKVYSQSGTPNLYIAPVFRESGIGGDWEYLPNINTLLSANNTPIRQIRKTLSNNDPCGRSVGLKVFHHFGTVRIRVDAGSTLSLTAQVYDIGTPGEWRNDSSLGLGNNTTGSIMYNPGDLVITQSMIIPPNTSITIGQRWLTGPTPAEHTTGGWTAIENSVYGSYMTWEMSSEINGMNIHHENLAGT